MKQQPVQVRRLAGLEQALRDQVAARVDATLLELCAWLGQRHSLQVGRMALWRELRRLGLTLKKSRSGQPSRTGRIWSKRAGLGETISPALAVTT